MIYEEDEFTDVQVGLLLAYTLRESPFSWVLSLRADTMHLCDLIEDTFYHFDVDYLEQKQLQ